MRFCSEFVTIFPASTLTTRSIGEIGDLATAMGINSRLNDQTDTILVRLVRRNRGWTPARAACQASDRGQDLRGPVVRANSSGPLWRLPLQIQMVTLNGRGSALKIVFQILSMAPWR